MTPHTAAAIRITRASRSSWFWPTGPRGDQLSAADSIAGVAGWIY